MNRVRLFFARCYVFLIRIRDHAFVQWFYRNAPSDIVVQTRIFGVSVPVRAKRTMIHGLLSLHGERFLRESSIFRPLINPGDTVFDVGANIGYFSLYFRSLVGSTGKVYAIEPDPDNIEDLQAVVDATGQNGIELLPVAAGADCKSVSFEPGLNSTIDVDGSYQVQQISLDSIRDRKPDFIKVDVEGYEGEVLKGMWKTIRELKPRLLMEIHPHVDMHGHKAAEMVAELSKEYAHVTYYRHDNGGNVFQRIYKRYRNTRAIVEIDDLDAFLKNTSNANRQTFWLICKP